MQQQNELSSGLRRIRRGADWPDRVVHERACKRKYPKKMMITTKNTTYVLIYRKSRWNRMDMYTGCVRQRELFCWLLLEKRQVGALHLVEFEPDIGVDNNEFLDTMDADSQADADLSVVLCDAWSDVANDVLAYGPVLEFRLAWMSPEHAKSAVWTMAAEALIKAEFDDYSILVMKAFPLEYEGRSPEGSPAHDGLIRRQAAMIRYYRRLFGVDRFPGKWGSEGWLWRARPRIAELIPAPAAGQ